MTITQPAVGDKATAAWADSVAVAVNSLGFVGEGTAGANVTLSTTNAFASTAVVTFALTTTTRIRIDVQSAYTLATGVAGRYQTRAGYNTGSSAVIGSVVNLGQGYFSAGSIAGLLSGAAFGTVLLAAGTYTAYASVQRFSGGATTDTAGTFDVIVTAVGYS